MTDAALAPKAAKRTATAAHAEDRGRAAFLRTTRAVADDTRLSVLRVLQQESFGVLELCEVLQITQPALSHHLRLLHEAGLVAKRREGNHIFYRRSPNDDRALAAGLLAAIDALPLDVDTQVRMQAVQDARRARSQAFFDTHAADFADQQARICDHTVYAGVAMDMVARHCTKQRRALEIGPGDGAMLGLLAKGFDSVLGIDSSPKMLQHTQDAGAENKTHNVRLRCADFLELGQHNRFELIMASMVVHHMPSPARFFRQARQLMTRAGLLLVAELCPHDQEWAQKACGDLWLGFEAEDLNQWAAGAGFAAVESQYLAERNGFRIQLLAYQPASRSSNAGRRPAN